MEIVSSLKNTFGGRGPHLAISSSCSPSSSTFLAPFQISNTQEDQPIFKFLWKSAQNYTLSDPALASLLVWKLTSLAEETETPLSTKIQKKICPYCKSIFIPAVNCSIRVVPKKNIQKKKKKRILKAISKAEHTRIKVRNFVKIKCSICKKSTLLPATREDYLKDLLSKSQTKEETNEIKNESPMKTSNKSISNTSTKILNKKKEKSKKIENLKKLLEEEKQKFLNNQNKQSQFNNFAPLLQ